MMTSGKKLDNRYIIREQIGKGGFGAVYLAEDTRFTGSNLVAIKKIHQSNEQTSKAFYYEANLLYNLSHPNLPKVTNCFQEDESNFIVMDYIGGEDLMNHLKKGRNFSIEEVLSISDKVLDALEYLHSFSIFHRDIKPHNIKIDANGKIFLLDFGTAKGDLNSNTLSTTDQSVSGYTPFYAPLEQILRVDTNSYLLLNSLDSPNLERFTEHKTDARSDIYSLGATVYHLLTGFSPEKATGTIRAHLVWSGKSDPLPPIRRLNPQISERLAWIIDKCLKIEPDERFQTAKELRDALRSLNVNEPISVSDQKTLAFSTDEILETQPGVPDQNIEKTQAVVQDLHNAETQRVAVNSPETNLIQSAITVPGEIISSKSEAKSHGGLYAGLLGLLLILSGFGGWFAWRSVSDTGNTQTGNSSSSNNNSTGNNGLANNVTERSFKYSLLVQKIRDGKKFQEPFESSGQEIFENGYQFQVRLTAPETGFLYAFAEGLNDKGERVYNIVFPTPKQNKGKSEVEANQSYETGWNEFGGTAGTENFWIIWSKEENKIAENARDNAFQSGGTVVAADIKAKLKDYLEQGNKIEKTISKDTEKKLTKVDFRNDNFVYLLQLEHR